MELWDTLVAVARQGATDKCYLMIYGHKLELYVEEVWTAER